MQTYPINELERLTGIKAHTIRIWEKRYGLITPERTTTNRRYYSDKQVKKLLNVTTLLSYGKKISRIAEMSEEDINKEIFKDGSPLSQNKLPEAHINELVKCMLTYDEAAFEQTFLASVAETGLYGTMMHVVYPFLEKVGTLWRVDRTAPVQEHFASGIIRRKLMAATDALPQPGPDASSFLLFLPENEWHEIALLFANYIIRATGHKTIYLGQNVPFENIVRVCNAVSPGYMLLFYISAKPVKEIETEIKGYAGVDKDIRVLIAGKSDLLPVKTKIKNVTYLPDVNALQRFL